MSKDTETPVESSESQKPTSEPPSSGESSSNSSSERPVSRTKHFIERANAMKGIILAISALAASAASFFKPPDVSAAKNSFEHTSKQIETISAVSIQNHDDIVALRGYLEGYVKAQSQIQQKPDMYEPGMSPEPRKPPGTSPGQGFGSGIGRLGGSHRSPSPRAVASAQSPIEPQKAVQNRMEVRELPPPPIHTPIPTPPLPTDGVISAEVPPLPPISPRPKAIKSESFDSARF